MGINDLAKDVAKLVDLRVGSINDARLQALANPRPQPRGAAPAVTSAVEQGSAAGSGDADFNFDGVEKSREYYGPEDSVTTTDGLFTFPTLRAVTFKDAGGHVVRLKFSKPSATNVVTTPPDPPATP